MSDPFFRLHHGLDREGPGSPEDGAWALEVAGVTGDAQVCDVASGPGADTETLLALLPEAHVTAVDAHKPFVDEILGRIGVEPRLTAYAGDMLKLKGPFDLIWSAGAVYFVGIAAALTAWRPCLRAGGAVAFSEPCFFVDAPSEAARSYWEGYATQGEAEILAAIAASDYEVLERRRLSDAAWAAYHGPMAARIAVLRPGADDALNRVLDEAEAEIDTWQEVKHETGYLLTVARPG
ncbi:MAG: class I SAM-dependent methyltransferase [Pseudomonadota bacterium]